MSSETLLFIILSGILALFVAAFQYFKKKKSMSKLDVLFAFLRFVTVFSVLLLLVNPTFDQISTFVEKPKLVLAIDNSSSIKHLKQDEKALGFISKLSSNQQINEKFDLETYTFGASLKASDSVSFSEKQTNIHQAFSQLNQVFKQTTAPTLLISDGNQTLGNDYQYVHHEFKQPIFPVILGDTVKYTDLKIQQLNVNKYAYHQNKFPVEAIVVYNGNKNISTKFIVTKGNTTVYSEQINFSKDDNSKVLNFNLLANAVGVGNYKATLVPLDVEKNKLNNSQNFTVEVLNQKTKIAIVSDILHPDLGALKSSIESNEQRSVSIEYLNNKTQIDDYQLLIVYQPNKNFNVFFETLKKQNKSLFFVVGPKTDLNFLNQTNENFNIEDTQQLENYQAELNRNFSPFLVRDIDFESFPPLLSPYGSVSFSVPFETILNKSVNGVSVQSPLLATYEKERSRHAVLFGENIWQWRAQSFLNANSFEEFDNFIGKIIQYLASNRAKSRLNIDYESFYNGNSNVIVTAEFFDKNYVFDARASLSITVVNEETNETKTFPFVIKNNNYQVDLSSLPPSKYSFTVRANQENLSKSGAFQILEYYVEQQFLNANVSKMKQLAENSGGNSYFVNNTGNIIKDLLNDNRFMPIQKSIKKSISLIDWKYLLALIALSLGLEWFLRKYNGLI